ncbi:MAG: LptF/LptG family permease [Alphaproteobacteria bacterium]
MKEAKYYIISVFFKYILINIFIFLGLIWLSQVLRILELQYSISNQIFDVIKTTCLVLPSFINPLMPFLILLGSFFANYKFNSNNEMVILKQYLNIKQISNLLITLMFSIFIFYSLNNEYFSTKMYHKYKVEELNIRNNLKLGTPSQNEFHIDNELSIFFESYEDDIFYNIEAVIYNEGQFIKSKSAIIEISKKNFNLIFNTGERLLLNSIEKSKTNFDKFTYSIENKDIEDLLMDKEHYNTFELINHENKEFINHGHNRIYQYILTIIIIYLSFKIIFLYEPKKNLFKKFGIIFIFLLIVQILNSYFIYIMNNKHIIAMYYYLFNFIILSFFTVLLNKFLK